MLPAMLEELAFGAATIALFALQRIGWSVLVGGLVDIGLAIAALRVMTWSVSCLRSGCATKRTHRNKIGVGDGANVSEPESNQGGSAAGRSDEFDLETVRRVNLDDSAQVPSSKPLLG